MLRTSCLELHRILKKAFNCSLIVTAKWLQLKINSASFVALCHIIRTPTRRNQLVRQLKLIFLIAFCGFTRFSFKQIFIMSNSTAQWMRNTNLSLSWCNLILTPKRQQSLLWLQKLQHEKDFHRHCALCFSPLKTSNYFSKAFLIFSLISPVVLKFVTKVVALV